LNKLGEIDVVFQHKQARFILEAEWEQKRSREADISKLGRRSKQRLAGTIGMFLSMSGYSSDTLDS
jgi:Holliday junction resolvase-like predicted endonuclease